MNYVRVKRAFKAAGYHLLASSVVAFLGAFCVFYLWYPYPFDELSGGKTLFLLLVSVDVVCGPLLTLVVFDFQKNRGELWRDLGIICFIQIFALCYGLSTMLQARPIFIAFEGDRFRLVTKSEIDIEKISDALPELRNLGLTGPKPLGVRLSGESDTDFRESILLSLEGLHPSFRPERWTAYDSQRGRVIDVLKPFSSLYNKYPDKTVFLDSKIKEYNVSVEEIGYLPLVSKSFTDWIIIIDKSNANIFGYVHLDGWD